MHSLGVITVIVVAMPKERCWQCRKMKSDVSLGPSDDRICGDCFRENERILAQAKNSADANKLTDKTEVLQPSSKKKGRSGAVTAVETSLAAASTDITLETSTAADQQPESGDISMVQQLALLRAEVKCQQNTIESLQTQLTFVLSLLGIAEQDVQPITSVSGSNSNTSGSSGSSMPTNTVCHAEATATVADKSLWSTVVAKQQKTQKCTNNFQQSLIAAVYCDQSERKRRESSLIVSGITEGLHQPDSETFTKLCQDEFGIQPDIVSTRRLGHVHLNKPRPLLISMRTPSQAQQLITQAKQLRRSQNQLVRDNVYINRNQTKAEAEAAYQLRVQRRQAAERRKDATLSSSVPSFNSASTDTEVSLSLLNIASNPQTVLPPPPVGDRPTGRQSLRQQ